MQGKRIPTFDNAKFILILFVVAGHLLAEFRLKAPFLHYIYNLIYAFHIPAFVFISGLFSKPRSGFQNAIRLGIKILIPYIVFQILYHAFFHFFLHTPFTPLPITEPHWTMWFLASLFCWKVMLGYALKLRMPLLWTFAAGLLIGVFDSAGCDYSLCRTFVFFPFFVMGHLSARIFEDKHDQADRTDPDLIFEKVSMFIKTQKARWPGLALFTVAAAVLFLPDKMQLENLLLGCFSYTEMDLSLAQGIVMRSVTYLLNIVAVCGFLLLVPRRRLFFSSMGEHTLYVYLLHGFFVKLMIKSSYMHDFVHEGHYWLFAVAPVVLTVILSTKLVTEFTKPLVEVDIPESIKQFFYNKPAHFRSNRRHSC